MGNLRQNFSKLLKKIIWQIDIPLQMTGIDAIHVDLGAGNVPRNPFNANKLYATDLNSSFITKEGYVFIKSDLTQTLPFEDNSISSMSAFDVLEHIPRWERTNHGVSFPFVNLMNEIYRVLTPGGIFLAVMPAFPNQEAFKDPTHINMMSKATIQYFALPEPWAKLLGYGFNGGFEVETQCWLRGKGPYLSSSVVNSWRSSSGMKRITIVAIIVGRIASLKKRKKDCPLLWVLRKPISISGEQ